MIQANGSPLVGDPSTLKATKGKNTMPGKSDTVKINLLPATGRNSGAVGVIVDGKAYKCGTKNIAATAKTASYLIAVGKAEKATTGRAKKPAAEE